MLLAKYGKMTITRPKRLKVIKQFVEEGDELIMAGSWFTFAGGHGQSGWRKSPVADVLSVEILSVNERVETPEGAEIKVLKTGHFVIRDVSWEECFPYLGYNKVIFKDGTDLLTTIKPVDAEEADPLITVWEYGKEQVITFTSDYCSYGGMSFMTWKYYPQFWSQTVKCLNKMI